MHATYLHEGNGPDSAHFPQLRHILCEALKQAEPEGVEPRSGILVGGVTALTLPDYGLSLLMGEAGRGKVVAGGLATCTVGRVVCGQVSVRTAAATHWSRANTLFMLHCKGLKEH